MEPNKETEYAVIYMEAKKCRWHTKVATVTEDELEEIKKNHRVMHVMDYQDYMENEENCVKSETKYY